MSHRLEFRAMGCEMLALLEAETQPSLLSKVPEWFEEWEQILSRFRFDSELMQLNQTHEQPVQVSQTLWDVLQASYQAEQMTNGLVTPTLLDAIVEAGYDRPFDLLPQQISHKAVSDVSSARPLTSIMVNPSDRTVTLPSGMSLDFGGIAKGWAAHQAVTRLQAAGPALVNAGGDIAISGPRIDGTAWPIGVINPLQKGEEI
jgi:thiamine biosynthesis lipoprotein